VSPDQLNALGAFLSGIGSVLSAFLALHYERRRGEKECARRMAALREGMTLQRQAEGRE
jgi:hypothetical protein